MARMSGLLWRAADKKNPGFIAEAFYDMDTREYEVMVILNDGEYVRSRRFQGRYDPRFGIAVTDLDEMKSIAAKLADEMKPQEKP